MLGDFKSILFIQSFISICQQNMFLIIYFYSSDRWNNCCHHVQTVLFFQRLENKMFKYFSISMISGMHSKLFKSTVRKGFKH